ncbi:MAG: hypothetical protein QXG03_02875 [Halalkalicoccus sp.]
MPEEFIELAIHALLLAFYSVLGVGLTAASALVEYRSYTTAVAGGDLLLAGWIAAIGLVVLAFAYFLFRDKALAEYRHLTG